MIVPTVERALPPSRRWSITTTGDSPSISSTSGRVHFGNRLRANGGNVSFTWWPASAAMVSNTSDDLPDPETPAKATSRLRGMSTSRPARLFVRAPRMRMMRSLMGRR